MSIAIASTRIILVLLWGEKFCDAYFFSLSASQNDNFSGALMA
ncbi:hypothetical protein [Okeania sp. SIO1I7]|nr:hypothetical protein [Okeania sp. SIO1I7]